MSEMLFHVDIELDGIGEVQMPLTWKAHKRLLSEEKISPKRLYDLAVNTQSLEELTEEAIVAILYVGVTEAGKKVTRDQVGEAVFRTGFYNVATVIGMYLSGFMHGGISRKWKPKDDGDSLPLEETGE